MDLRVCAHHAFTMDGNLAIISRFFAATAAALQTISGNPTSPAGEAPNFEDERVQDKGPSCIRQRSLRVA